MGQLHSGYAALFMNETNDSAQHLDVLVAPDAKILGTDSSFGKNGRCLSQHQSSATNRAAPEMNEMPVVRESVAARILTHRRDEHPIRKRQISNRERIKQAGHGQRSVIVLSCQLPSVPACHVLVSTKTEARAKAGYFSVIRMCGCSKVQFIRTVIAEPFLGELTALVR